MIELFVRTALLKKNFLIQKEITNSHQQSKLNSINDNKRTLSVGPGFSAKTYLMLKVLEIAN